MNQLPQATTVPLTIQMTDPVHQLYLVSLRIGDTRATFLVDTGCSISIIDASFYRLHLEKAFPPSDEIIQLTGLGGNKKHGGWWQEVKNVLRGAKQQMIAVKDMPISFGSLRKVLPVAIVSDLSHFGAPMGFTVDGFLGLDAMKMFNARIATHSDAMDLSIDLPAAV